LRDDAQPVDRTIVGARNARLDTAHGARRYSRRRQPERDRWLGDLDDTEGFTPVLRERSPLNPGQKKTAIEVKACADGQHTYVLCRHRVEPVIDHGSMTGQHNNC